MAQQQAIGDGQARELVAAARRIRERAYAPYSDFRTGAAVLTKDGSVYHGVLVENLIFGLAMCAERVAIFSAVTEGADNLQALAIVAPKTAGNVTFPCGPCLQVAIELGGPDMTIVAGAADDDEYEMRTIQQLAPGIPRRGDL